MGYVLQRPENLIASVRRYLRVVEIVLSAIGLIALVVAALGISNAMLAAVARAAARDRGAQGHRGRDRDVYRTFLVEAGVLGLVAASWARSWVG